VRARLLRDAEGSISALLCPALARVLQPRQWRGVRWLYAAAMRGGGVLGDDPGLGKTLQAIAVAEALVRGQHLLLQPRPPPPGPRRLIPLSLPPPPLRSLLQVHSGRACRVLVVAPANLVANWVAELRRWLGHTPHALAVQAVDGSSYMRATAQLCRFAATRPPDHAVAIVSYEMLHTHGDALRVGAGGVDLLVADEAHRLRREGGGRAAAVAAGAPPRWRRCPPCTAYCSRRRRSPTTCRSCTRSRRSRGRARSARGTSSATTSSGPSWPDGGGDGRAVAQRDGVFGIVTTPVCGAPLEEGSRPRERARA